MLKRVFKFLQQNWETLLLAFILSVAVWISAVVASDPNHEEQFPTSIPLKVSGLADDLQILGSVPDSVIVNLRAPQSLWEELQNNPELIQAKLDLSGLEQGQQQVAVSIIFDTSPVELTEVDPETIDLILEREVTELFPIQITLIGDLALGYEVGDILLTSKIATVIGPESLVSLINEIQGWITISNARDDLIDQLELIAVDQNGQQISGVTISPREISTTVQVVQSGGYREVVVKVETIGTLPSGYRLTNISVAPPTVTIFSSDPQLVAEMPGFVSTQPIDLRNTTNDLEVHLTLDLPTDVVMVGDDQSVEVQVGVAAIETTISLTLPIQILELGPGLSATLSPETIEVFLTGPLSVLDSLTPEDVIISISLSGLGPGTHLAETHAEVLSDKVVIESINPDTIEVIITQSDSATDPNPTSESTSTATP
ncbi:MAG: CdaR family protein [Chloroflexota bacterium]